MYRKVKDETKTLQRLRGLKTVDMVCFNKCRPPSVLVLFFKVKTWQHEFTAGKESIHPYSIHHPSPMQVDQQFKEFSTLPVPTSSCQFCTFPSGQCVLYCVAVLPHRRFQESIVLRRTCDASAISLDQFGNFCRRNVCWIAPSETASFTAAEALLST